VTAGRGTARGTLLAAVRPHRGVLVTATLLALLGSAAGLAQPLAAKAVIDALTEGSSPGVALVMLTVLVTASAVINGWSVWLLGRTGEQVVRGVRSSLATRLVRLQVDELDGRAPGDLVARATADTLRLRSAATTSLVGLVNGAVGMLGALVLMAVLDLLLFGVTITVLVLVGVVVGVVMPRIRVITMRAQEAVGLLGSALDRALGAARTVKAAGAEARETAVVSAAAGEAYQAGLVGARWNALLAVLSELSLQVSFLVVLGVGGALVAGGTLPVSTLVAFLLYLFYLTAPLAELVAANSALQEGLGAAARIAEVEALPIEPDVDAAGPQPARRPAPALVLEGVQFAYPGRDAVLHGVDVRVPGGSRVALVGPSGAGKSTVFALLLRFHDPIAGTVRIDGRDLASIPRSELRRRIGYVEQDAPALSGTFGENLRYAAPDAAAADVASVLRETRLDEVVARLPRGEDTEIGTRGATLSGGERQRLAIARAMLRRPEVLLLDEATSQLDARNEDALRETVARASSRCTVLVIAHRLSTVRDADQIVVLEGGRVRAAGSHTELLVRDDLYRELATTQLTIPG